MRSRLPPLLAFLAGCIATAGANTVEPDVLTLSSGQQIIGELLDVRDGKYWVLQPDGQIVSLDFRTVQTVRRGGSAVAPVPKADLPLPSWSARSAPDADLRPVQSGFDLGLSMAGRVRFNHESPALAHTDIRFGLSPVVSGGLGPLFSVGGELAFFADVPVHLTLSGSLGAAIVYGSFYPFVGVGSGVQFDPRGPLEVHVGATVGTTISYFAFVPDLSVSWMW